MEHHRRKRTASEPASALFEVDPELEARAKRPFSLVGGVIFVVMRALGTVVWALAVFGERHTMEQEFKLEPDEISAILIFLYSIAGLWMLFLLFLALRIWLGSNRARMLVLFGATLTIVLAAIGYLWGDEEITIRTTLLTLALDILILLALSSRDARSWSRAHTRERRARRAVGSVG